MPVDSTNKRFSIRAYRGHLTRVQNSIDQALVTANENPTSIARNHLSSLLADLRAKHDAIVKAYDALMFKDKETFDECEAKLAELSCTFDDIFLRANHTIARIDNALSKTSIDSIRPATLKVQLGLRPSKLSRDSTPEEMRTWIKLFQSYHSTSNMDSIEVSDQQSFFLQCFEGEFATSMCGLISENTPI